MDGSGKETKSRGGKDIAVRGMGERKVNKGEGVGGEVGRKK